MSERRITVPICKGCLNQVDPEVCGCGASRKGHGNPMDEGHAFLPMGCTCLMEASKMTAPDGYRAMEWPFPWEQPHSAYDNDGPRGKRGRQFDIVVCEVLFMVAPTGDTGITSGRNRYRVDCQDCNMILHENTTGVSPRIREHLAERHNIKVRW